MRRSSSPRRNASREEQSQIANPVLSELRELSYDECRDLMKQVSNRSVEQGGQHFQVEIEVRWDDREHRNVRVVVAVSERGLSDFFPTTADFIISPDGPWSAIFRPERPVVSYFESSGAGLPRSACPKSMPLLRARGVEGDGVMDRVLRASRVQPDGLGGVTFVRYFPFSPFGRFPGWHLCASRPA